MKKKPETTPIPDTNWTEMATQLAALNPFGGAVGMSGWVEVMTESTRFAAERFRKDLATQQALLNCKSVDEILRVQSEFYRNAIEQYTSELNRLGKMMSKATAQSMDEMTKSRARSYDDVPV